MLAFPIVFQIASTIDNYVKYSDRTTDVTALLVVVQSIINTFREAWLDTIDSEIKIENRTTRFLFGGWSWKEKRFVVYPIQFDLENRTYHSYTHKKIIRKLGLSRDDVFLSIGNYTAEFRALLRDRLQAKTEKTLDYEPLQILCEMLRTERFTNRRASATFYVDEKPGLIGGAPQMLKVYQHSNVKPFAIRWYEPKAANQVTLYGRRLLHHERTLRSIYDPETGEFTYPLSGIIN